MAYDKHVEQMLRDIRTHTRYCAAETGRQELEERVLEAVARLPQSLFAPPLSVRLLYFAVAGLTHNE